jgi:hypothetical protein
VLARQALFHLSPFLLCLFFRQDLFVFSLAGLDHGPPVYTSRMAGMAGVQHTPSLLLLEMESLFCFVLPGLAWNLKPPDLCLQCCRDYGHESLHSVLSYKYFGRARLLFLCHLSSCFAGCLSRWLSKCLTLDDCHVCSRCLYPPGLHAPVPDLPQEPIFLDLGHFALVLAGDKSLPHADSLNFTDTQFL